MINTPNALFSDRVESRAQLGFFEVEHGVHLFLIGIDRVLRILLLYKLLRTKLDPMSHHNRFLSLA